MTYYSLRSAAQECHTSHETIRKHCSKIGLEKSKNGYYIITEEAIEMLKKSIRTVKNGRPKRQ